MVFHRRRFNTPHKRPSAFGSHHAFYLACAMMTFWTLAEAIVSFVTPLKIQEAGFSDSMLGFILGTSSIAGALFDLVAVRFFKNTYYKRIFSIMFGFCLVFPLIMFHATIPLLFVLGMIVWGVYYDLRNIGRFDYIARTTSKENSVATFGILEIFQNIGWLVGPIIVGFLVGQTVGWKPFAAIYIFLGISIACFIGLCLATKRHEHKLTPKEQKVCRRRTWSEVRMMGRVGRALFPALALIFFLNFTDSYFWSIGPLFAEHIGTLGQWAGLLLTMWSLPGLFLGWFAGEVAHKFGKERTAFIMQFLGSVALIPISMTNEPVALLGVVFISAMFTSIAWPAIQGAFSDYIVQRPELEKEVEGLEDLYTNFGYIFGPISAGLLADAIGYGPSFTLLGFGGAAMAFFLVMFYPKRIDLGRKGPALICDID